jgi:hypothetical protein
MMDRCLLTTWVDRWRLKTHTFYLLCGDMAPTLEDVVYLLAYHCGVRPSVHESFHRTGSRICRTLSSWFRGFPERGRFKSTPGVGRPAHTRPGCCSFKYKKAPYSNMQ